MKRFDSANLKEGDKAILNAQLCNWITVSLEIAEIACKVLDWKTHNPKYRGPNKDAHGSQSSFGIRVCKEYLLLIEEISYQCEALGAEVRKKQNVRTQTLMFEVFKRVVNDELLQDFVSDSMQNVEELQQKAQIKRKDTS